MDALVTRARFAQHLLKPVVFVLLIAANTFAASHRTTNFVVTAKTKELAVTIAESAERYRAELAIEWLGHELPRWPEPCPIKAKVAPHLGAGGATSFLFETYEHQYARPIRTTGDGLFQAKPAGRPFGWEMSIQGSRDRILDSVLPHEVTHTIFATHFGRPLPRWADEGACTTVEHSSEKAKQHRMLYEFLKTGRGISFNDMFSMNEYPADILPLYSQGFSLARYLIQQGGKRKFVKYVEDGLNTNNWTETTRSHYGYQSLSELQVTWLDWVRNGSVDLSQPNDRMPNGPDRNGPSPEPKQIYLASNNVRNQATPRAVINGAPQRDILPGRVVPLNSESQFDRGRPTTLTSLNASQHNDTAVAQASHNAFTKSSWYVSRSRQARGSHSKTNSTRPKFDASTKNQWASNGRVTSRPDAKKHQREVLLEWGQPAPFLTPPQTAGQRPMVWR